MKILYWIIVVIICFYLTFEHNVHPLLVYGIAGILFFLIWGLSAYLKGSHEDKMKIRVNDIKEKYPKAYKEFTSIKGNYVGEYSPSIESLERVACRKDEVWEKEEKELIEEEEKRRKDYEIKSKKWHEKAGRIKKDYPDGYKKWEETEPKKWLYKVVTDPAICDAENDIRSLDQQIKNDNWQKDQTVFAKHCRELRDELLNTYGCYPYYIRFEGVDNTIEYKIWQLFPYSFCLEEDLDYTHFPTEKKNGQLVKDHKALLPVEQADAIAAYINRLNKEEKTNVYFCPIRDGWDSIFYNDLSTNIIASLDDSVDFIDMSDPFSDTMTAKQSDIEKWISSLQRRVVILDLATDYYRLIATCEEVIDKTKEKRPLITFISVQKGYTREEMVKLIDKDKKRRKEEAERMQEQAFAQKTLVKSVSSWDTLVGGLHYSFLFYYYPTTCDFEASEEEWANRWTIWSFKNTPGKTSSSDHEEALEKIIPLLKDKLLSTFDAVSLKYLTFVCIPASTQVNTQARYEDFSDRICKELGMINAYQNITLVEDKEERRSGGTSIDTSKLSFNEEFFKGKYVLLFDDVITRGDSMRTFKDKMESLGAVVVGGLSLGKTKHERPIQTQPFPPMHAPFPPLPEQDYDDSPFVPL